MEWPLVLIVWEREEKFSTVQNYVAHYISLSVVLFPPFRHLFLLCYIPGIDYRGIQPPNVVFHSVAVTLNR